MTRWNSFRPKNKYGASKVEYDGITFDSKKEERRYKELRLMERAGEIKGLKRQVRYSLIPAQRAASKEIYKRGARKGENKPGKLLERECSYIADFVYTRTSDGATVVEDTKGMRTKEYILKRKMMLYFHGIRITEI